MVVRGRPGHLVSGGRGGHAEMQRVHFWRSVFFVLRCPAHGDAGRGQPQPQMRWKGGSEPLKGFGRPPSRETEAATHQTGGVSVCSTARGRNVEASSGGKLDEL